MAKILSQKERMIKELETRNDESKYEFEGEIRNLGRLLEKERGLTTQYLKELTQERSKVNILGN